MTTRRPRRLLLLTTVCAAGLAGGCGWTARDEFLVRRSVVVPARPGDGSELAYRVKPGESRVARWAGAEMATSDDR